MNTRRAASRSTPVRPSLKIDCRLETPLAPERRKFLSYLEELLGSPVRLLSSGSAKESQNTLETVPEQDPTAVDLLVHWRLEPMWWQRWLGLSPGIEIVSQSENSVLLVQDPHLPIQRILLIVRQHESDRAALDWMRRLVRPNQTEVFILPIVPSIPAMYRFYSLPIQAELPPEVFISEDFRRMLSNLFSALRIRATMLLHNGTPQQRIKWASACEYDLVVISAEPYPKIQRRFFGEVEKPLIMAVRKPILIARASRGLPV